MAFYTLERLIHLYDGYQKTFSIAGHSLLLIQEEGRRYLLLNQCPHQQAALDKGSILQGEIRCPLHGMRFNLETGATQDGCQHALQFFPITYHESFLGIDL